jgi:phospholipid transport system substrate-binding protein
MKKILFFVMMMCCSIVFAATPNPVTTLQGISDQMIAGLKKNQASLKKNPQVVYRLVRQIVLPHADVDYMSKAVLGRTAWNSVNAAEQKAFTAAFTQTVIETYSSALSSYTDEKVQFYPVRGGYENQSVIAVQSQVIRADGPPVQLNYKVALVGGQWIVRDLNVEGVSLIQSFRSQFQDKLSQGKSVPQITAELKAKVRS